MSGGGQNSFGYQPYNSERPKSRSASISFTDPMVNDTKNLIGGSLYYRMMGGSTMYYSPLETTIAGASIMLGRIFKWPDDFFRGTWQLQVHRREYSGSQADIDNYAGGRTKSDGISLIQSIRRDSRDHPEFPTIGSHFSINSTLSGWKLGGQENFHKHTLNLEWFTPTFWKFVLMNSMKIGAIKELPSNNSNPSYIPYNDRFIIYGENGNNFYKSSNKLPDSVPIDSNHSQCFEIFSLRGNSMASSRLILQIFFFLSIGGCMYL